MFKKKFDPFARAERALTVFQKSLDELREAAADHRAVVDASNEQINQLAETAAQHHVAASNHERRINKIAEFLA